MTPVKSLFYGFGAYVGKINSETRCAFWPKDPEEVNFDDSLLVPIDLDENVAAAREGRIAWADVKVDEQYVEGGTTSIGPYFPDGTQVGAIYLEKSYWDGLPSNIRPDPPPGEYSARDYEFQTVVYWDGTGDAREGKRYFGFHAEILDIEASRAYVAVYDAGTSKVAEPRVKEWFDLDSIDVDAAKPRGGLTDLGVADGALLTGALFIEAERAARIYAAIPKLPPTHGTRPVVRRRLSRTTVAKRTQPGFRPIRLPGR